MLRVGARYRSTGSQPPDPEPKAVTCELAAVNEASRLLADERVETVVITRAEPENGPEYGRP